MVRATNENKMEVPWKGKHWATMQSSIHTAGLITWEDEHQKDTGWQSCLLAIFTLANTWTQWKCPSTEEWTKKWSMYTTEYYYNKKYKLNLKNKHKYGDISFWGFIWAHSTLIYNWGTPLAWRSVSLVTRVGNVEMLSHSCCYLQQQL